MVKLRDSLYSDWDNTIKEGSRWLREVSLVKNEKEFNLIECAYKLAKKIGENVPTATGISCMQHGLTMAEILLQLHLDNETIAAALIYSTVMHAELSLETVRQHLGSAVAKLVQGTLQMNAIRNFSKIPETSPNQLENIRKMLLAMVEDMRVVLLKLSERTTTMRTLRIVESPEARRYAEETQLIYAPLANRLGIGQLKWELEDLALAYLDSKAYGDIAKLLNERLITREAYIKNCILTVKKILFNMELLNVEVYGRPKHIHSIYKKMQQKNLEFHGLYDLNAIRILVETPEDCYKVLSIIHNTWTPILSQFDDYITNPKANGYQSIHTAITGPEEKIVEIQIRTHQMHEESEHGVAAHWQYKEDYSHKSSYQTKITWLRHLLEWQKDLVKQGQDRVPYLSSFLDDHVYVFTPENKVIDLPKGSTPLDFAYHIHTELGHRCRGAKVNNSIVPLTYCLNSGEQVEILKTKLPQPSRDWLNINLNYLRTSRARTKVLHWFKQQDQNTYLENGQALLEKEYQRLNLSIDTEKLAGRLQYKNKKDMYIALGKGDLRVSQVLNALPIRENLTKNKEEILLGKSHEKPLSGIFIAGMGQILTKTARCCNPLPGDSIIGFITGGKGVILHRAGCKNIINLNNDQQKRLISAEWRPLAKAVYPVEIYIEAHERPSLIHDVSSVISNEKINLIAFKMRPQSKQAFKNINLTIEITDLSDLSKLLEKIKSLPHIIEARRQLSK